MVEEEMVLDMELDDSDEEGRTLYLSIAESSALADFNGKLAGVSVRTTTARSEWPEDASPGTLAGRKREREDSGTAARSNDDAVEISLPLLEVEASNMSRAERRRRLSISQDPYVRVDYQNLPRESVKKLRECLQQWMQWHATYLPNSSGKEGLAAEERLETGSQAFYPNLAGGSRTTKEEVWVDLPALKVLPKEPQQDDNSSSPDLARMGRENFNRAYETVADVPLYDRSCDIIVSDTPVAEGYMLVTGEASRCFNCGSYNHSLKECGHPRNAEAIASARRRMEEKKGSGGNGGGGPTRYHAVVDAKARFPDSRPGYISAAVRSALGIGEFDPPPWLNRMRNLGYPPGYLEALDEPSGLTVFGEDGEEGALLPGEVPQEPDGSPREEGEVRESPPRRDREMTVVFEGINGPIPEQADPRAWAPVGGSGGTGFQQTDSSRDGVLPPLGRQLSDRSWTPHAEVANSAPLGRQLSGMSHSPQAEAPNSAPLGRQLSDRSHSPRVEAASSASLGRQVSGLHRSSPVEAAMAMARQITERNSGSAADHSWSTAATDMEKYSVQACIAASPTRPHESGGATWHANYAETRTWQSPGNERHSQRHVSRHGQEREHESNGWRSRSSPRDGRQRDDYSSREEREARAEYPPHSNGYYAEGQGRGGDWTQLSRHGYGGTESHLSATMDQEGREETYRIQAHTDRGSSGLLPTPPLHSTYSHRR